MLKSGSFIEENCALAPKTAALLRPMASVYNAFLLDPGAAAVCEPALGLLQGLRAYHLGVVIPADNADKQCWLRVNVDPGRQRAA